MESVAAIVKGLGIIRPEGKRPIVALQRLVEAPELLKGVAAVVESLGETWVNGEHSVVVIESRIVITTFRLRQSQEMACVKKSIVYRKNVGTQALGFRKVSIVVGCKRSPQSF